MANTSDGLDYEKKPDDYYENNRPEMLAFLPSDTKTALDVGCSNGSFGHTIKLKTKSEVWGIEPMESFATQAKDRLDKVLNSSIEDAIDKLPDNYFDVIYFNDVLEHLIDPYTVLEEMKSKLKPGGKVISSIPNIRYFRTFFKILFKGEWTYEDRGIMDRTHLRFFTKKSILDMYKNAGYTVEKHEGLKPGSSIRPFLINIPLLFTATDMKFMQFATVASVK